MTALQTDYLAELERYMRSADFTEDFFCSSEERRGEILEFMEKLMELGELADEIATKIIFRRKDAE